MYNASRKLKRIVMLLIHNPSAIQQAIVIRLCAIALWAKGVQKFLKTAMPEGLFFRSTFYIGLWE